MNERTVASRIRRALFAVGFPVAVWAVIVAMGWFFPVTRQLFLINAPLFLAVVVFAFSVLVRGVGVWLAVLMALVYFPAMYVLIMYLEAVVGYRLYGTYF